MSTILKALRRLEDDEASRRAEQPTELREHLVNTPARREPRRSWAWVWLLAIPGAGLMGALVAALLLPAVLERDDPSPFEAPAALPIAASPPVAAQPVPGVTQVPLDVARAPTPSPPQPVSAPGRAPGVSSPAPARAPGVSSPAPARAPGVSSPAPPSPSPFVASLTEAGPEPRLPATPSRPPAPLAESAAAPLGEERSWAEPERSIEISDDFAVIERNPLPAILVTQTIWHPRAERRVAVIERLDAADGAEPLRLREGDLVGPLQLVVIEPTGVVFRHDGIELRRRVGARP